MLARAQPKGIADTYKKLNADNTNRLELQRLRAGLQAERSSFDSHWAELGRFIFPRRTRMYTTDVDRGNRRNTSIINSTGGLAARTLRSGMMSGFTSPSRPWFRMTTIDPDLAKFDTVKEWLYDVTWRMSEVFLRSNLYTSLQTVYGDMGVFGTAAMLIEEDLDRVIHTYPFAIGSYYFFADDKLKINGFMRDFRMTVRQIVEKFGVKEGSSDIDWTNISAMVRSLWNDSTTEAWIDVTHAIIPNNDWNPNSKLSASKRYLSIYYERGSTSGNLTLSQIDSTKVLSRKGYDKFRVLGPRWDVTGEDVYGTYCPGMEALGDIQGLQIYEKRGAQALEKLINPAMVGPVSLRGQKASILPGDVTYLATTGGGQTFAPAYQINPNFQQFNIEKAAIQQRIERAFFKDLWLAVSELDKGNVTAEEIRALKEEKLQEVGPVIDRLNQDLLDPLVEQTFDLMNAQGHIPPPPPELAKAGLRVEYTSIMSQASRALNASVIERFMGFVTQVQQVNPNDPSALDKVNKDELLDHLGESLTLPPGIILDDDKVAQLRAQRAQAQQAQQKAAAMEQASKTAKNLAQAPTEGGNALSDLLTQAKAGDMQP